MVEGSSVASTLSGRSAVDVFAADEDTESVVVDADVGVSIFEACLTLTMSVVGAGMLALPSAFKCTGVLSGFAILIVVGISMLYTGELLVRCHDAAPLTSYAQFAERAFGKKWAVAVPIVNIVGLFGGCTAYVSIAKDIFPYFWLRAGLTPSIHPHDVPWYWSAELWVAAILLIVALPLCLQRDIGALRYSSYLGFCFSSFLVAIIAYRGIDGLIHGTSMWHTPIYEQNPLQCSSVGAGSIPVAVSIFSFSFVFHLNVVPLYVGLKPSVRTSANMRFVVRATVAICFVLYTTIGTLGYSLFGQATSDNVLDNFSPMDDVVNAARAAICVCCYTCLPLLVHPLRSTIISLVEVARRDSQPKEPSRTYNAMLTILLLMMQYTVALLIPSVKSVFSFTGGSAVVGFCYLFPAGFAAVLLCSPSSKEVYYPGTPLLPPPPSPEDVQRIERGRREKKLLVLIAFTSAALGIWAVVHTAIALA